MTEIHSEPEYLKRRRDFLLRAADISLLAPLVKFSTMNASTTLAETQVVSSNDANWFRSAYRRAVIDMHISEWDEDFLSKFDAKQFAEMLELSRSQSIVCYAHSHAGLFNYPTNIGRQHPAWRGRNVLEEMIEACHSKGIAVVLYVSLIFDRDAGDSHPEWRTVEWDGKPSQGGRHAFLCPNSPYREYVRSFLKELCQKFDFEGVRCDMTFWPRICYCQHCRRRFREEVGGDLPKVVDWNDSRWVSFQRSRSRWLNEFASLATATVKEFKPHATVEHQSSTYPQDWQNGVVGGLVDSNDFLQGDFYGDQLQGSFVRKLLSELSPKRPFGYETCRSVRLQDHTAIKPQALLEAKAAAAVADNAAFVFIDAIDPVGTVDSRPHQRMGEVFDRLMPYYSFLGGSRVADIYGYYSFESKFDFRDNGSHVKDASHNDSHTSSTMNAASHILSNHLPYGVLTKASLRTLPDAKVLCLSNVNMMDEDECEIIRDWVSSGGCLYASGVTSIVDKSGRVRDDFALSDVFGVTLNELAYDVRNRYLSPTPLGRQHFFEFNQEYPAYIQACGPVVSVNKDAEIVATSTLPWTDNVPSHFSSIHSDPPWRNTNGPEIVLNSFGKGQSVFSASPIEDYGYLANTFISLIKLMRPHFVYEARGPGCVELSMFRQPEKKRYRLSLVNFQESLLERGEENVPVTNMQIRLRIPERVKRVTLLPSGDQLPMTASESVVSFSVPRVDTLTMLEIKV